MPIKASDTHKVEATIAGVDIEVPGYHVGFFVEHVTVTNTAQPIPEIAVEPETPLLKLEGEPTFDKK